jgi:cobalt-zinc-cadmium resistance protein CzcA
VQDALRVQIEGQRAGMVIDGGGASRSCCAGPMACGVPRALPRCASAQPTAERAAAALAKLDARQRPGEDRAGMGSRYSVVIANVAAATWSASSRRRKAKVAQEVKLPTGYRMAWGGQFENQQRAAARLAWSCRCRWV